jgi:hypothetical protein
MIETICHLRRAGLLAAFVGCILLSDGGASAGQLHVEEVTLDEVAEHGFALLGTIVSRAATSHAVQVKVKKISRGPRSTEQQQREGSTVGSAPGLYCGCPQVLSSSSRFAQLRLCSSSSEDEGRVA